MEQTFSFQITPPDPDRLLWQVARALEMRTELVSREKCPRLWVLADRLNHKDRGPLAVRKKAPAADDPVVINWLLGLILLVPGLMDPRSCCFPCWWARRLSARQPWSSGRAAPLCWEA